MTRPSWCHQLVSKVSKFQTTSPDCYIDVCGVSTSDARCDDPFPNFPPPQPKFEVPKFPMMTSNKFQIAPINVQRIPLQWFLFSPGHPLIDGNNGL
jgi:hypothetical protein